MTVVGRLGPRINLRKMNARIEMKPLFPWQPPPVGRRFTPGMTWSDFGTFLHREAGHAIVFGALPVAIAFGHTEAAWWLGGVAIVLAALRAVLVGVEPTRVGFRAFFNLFR